ncbi:TIGR04222 domain-containing membrane protein, partial [Streptomyces hainanensis]
MLAFYILAGLPLAIGLARLFSARRRALNTLPKQLGEPAVESPYEAAFLIGGPGRVADTVLCALYDKGRILIDGGVLHVVEPVADDALEREVLTQCGTGWEAPMRAVRRGLAGSEAVVAVGERLVARGLLLRPSHRLAWRSAARLAVTLALVVCLVSLVLLIVLAAGDSSETTGAAVMVAVAVGALMTGLVFGPGRDPLPTAGVEAVSRYRLAVVGATALAPLVAVGGIVALTDLDLRAQLADAAVLPLMGSGSAAATGGWAPGCGAAVGTTGGDTSSPGNSGGGCGGASSWPGRDQRLVGEVDRVLVDGDEAGTGQLG